MMDSFGRSHESSIESVGDDGRRKDGSRITNSFGHVHLSKTKLVSQDRGAQDSATQRLPCTVWWLILSMYGELTELVGQDRFAARWSNG